MHYYVILFKGKPLLEHSASGKAPRLFLTKESANDTIGRELRYHNGRILRPSNRVKVEEHEQIRHRRDYRVVKAKLDIFAK